MATRCDAAIAPETLAGAASSALAFLPDLAGSLARRPAAGALCGARPESLPPRQKTNVFQQVLGFSLFSNECYHARL